MNSPVRQRAPRIPMLLLGIASLLAGVWGGLVRLPLNLPLPGGNANWITYHGPLMVCGFLGTVIGLERAVGLRGLWPYGAPVLTGLGSLLIIGGRMDGLPALLITIGSVWFWVVTLWVVKLQRVTFTIVMSLGALAWAAGNFCWWKGWAFPRVVPWWIAFLALTIVGERLDLSRFQKPSRWAQPLLLGGLIAFGAGVLCSAWSQAVGERVLGAGMLGLAAWLGRFDLARRSVKQPGLPRFMAGCLLVGYVWLALSGALIMAYAPLEAGLRYDAALHTFFLGFVFMMIFGHAPIIFPAVLVLQPVFSKFFYAHAALLNIALLTRVGGDVLQSGLGRQWGGILSAVAIALFLMNTVGGFVVSALRRPAVRPKRRVAAVGGEAEVRNR